MDNTLFVQNIRNACKKKGITISKMETELGLSQGLISRWSKTCPSFDKVAMIVKYLDISFESLMEGEEEDSDPSPSEPSTANQVVKKLIDGTVNCDITWMRHEDSEELENLILTLEDAGCPSGLARFYPFKNGYIILAMVKDEDLYLSLRLYFSPDKNFISPVPCDSNYIVDLLKLVDQDIYTVWMTSQSDLMMKDFLNGTY